MEAIFLEADEISSPAVDSIAETAPGIAAVAFSRKASIDLERCSTEAEADVIEEATLEAELTNTGTICLTSSSVSSVAVAVIEAALSTAGLESCTLIGAWKSIFLLSSIIFSRVALLHLCTLRQGATTTTLGVVFSGRNGLSSQEGGTEWKIAVVATAAATTPAASQ